MNSRLLHFRKHSWPGVLPIILIAACIGGLISFGFGKICLGILAFGAILLFCKSVEDLFLFWLLTFSFFSIDESAFLTVGTHPIITFDRVFIAVLFLIFLKQIALGERKPLPIDKLEISFILLLGVFSFSVATKTLDKLMGARVITDLFFLPFIIYILTKNFITDRKYFRKFINTLFIVGIYLSIMGIYEHFTQHNLFATGSGFTQESFGWIRVNGPYSSDTTFAVCIVICFFIALYQYVAFPGENTMKKLLQITVLIMTIAATFFTLFRGIWLAWAFGLLVWFFIRKKGIIKLACCIIALTLFTIPFVSLIRSSKFSSEFYKGRVANVSNIEDRLARYNQALSMFLEEPIQGIGFQNYPIIMKTTAQHNQLLAILSETGIMGASVYILLFFLLLYYSVRNLKSSNLYFKREFSIVYLSILVVYLVSGLGLTTGYDKHINLLFFTVSAAALNATRKGLLE